MEEPVLSTASVTMFMRSSIVVCLAVVAAAADADRDDWTK